jgi:hypothetical protein
MVLPPSLASAYPGLDTLDTSKLDMSKRPAARFTHASRPFAFAIRREKSVVISLDAFHHQKITGK